MFDRGRATKYVDEIRSLTESSVADMDRVLKATINGQICADRDFAAFEFSFYYFFIYDYEILHKLSEELRITVGDVFSDRIIASRKTAFSERDLAECFDNRVRAYFGFMKKAIKVVDFLSAAADYMNALLTVSIAERGYTLARPADIRDMRRTLPPDLYTRSIYDTLARNASLLL